MPADEKTEKAWETYEQVAAYLLNQVAAELGLQRVEGKQKVPGYFSQAEYEIDGKGVNIDGEGFVIIECRQYRKSRQNQEKMASLAFRILDTKATGGIVVSPLGFQEGAAKIASAVGIHDVRLRPDSDYSDYMLRFLNRIFVGLPTTAATAATTNFVVTQAAKRTTMGSESDQE